MRKIGITETVLRDAQQSLIATRMPYSDFENILSDINKAGYYSTCILLRFTASGYKGGWRDCRS